MWSIDVSLKFLIATIVVFVFDAIFVLDIVFDIFNVVNPIVVVLLVVADHIKYSCGKSKASEDFCWQGELAGM